MEAGDVGCAICFQRLGYLSLDVDLVRPGDTGAGQASGDGSSELFRDIENFQVRTNGATSTGLSRSLRDRIIEVRGTDGDILYMSQNLSKPVLSDGIDGFIPAIGGRDVRIIFRDQTTPSARI
jgi:hypothetical protein